MTIAKPAETRPELPPIVLFIDSDRDTLERYSRYLEDAGLWVAATALADEAIAAAEELKPDIVVADADTQVPGDSVLAETFKEHATLKDVPVIVLASDTAQGTAADRVLIKPVSEQTLLQQTREVLARARQTRTRAQEMIRRGSSLLERTAALVDKTTQMNRAARRACPQCGQHLDWVERGTIDAVTYDYYRGCRNGCGLFCFDVSQEKWVRLA